MIPKNKEDFPCIWKEDEDGVWDTECGNRFEIITGTLIENQMNFCPYCGKGLREESLDDT